MKYQVTVRGEGTSSQTRVIEAPSRFAVYEQVQKEGGFVVDIREDKGGFGLPAWLTITIGTGVKRSEIIRMAKNLSAMLHAGLSLSRALSVIERQSSNKRLKEITTGLTNSIAKGSSFHEALAKYPKIFSELFIAMSRAGEESGALAESLSIVALQMERSEELRRKIRGAMIYPSIILTAIVIVTILMLIFVVPTLTKTFTELGVEVPLATMIIVTLSNFMVENSILVLAILLLLIAGSIAFFRSKRGGSLVLVVSLYLPVINELVRETYAARASRTMSSLLSSGVPVLETLSITRDVVHANVFAKVIEDAEARVKKGEPLSASFAEQSHLYPVLMSEMLLVGEETGKVSEMLKQVAEFYEMDVAEKTKDLSTIIEPVLMLLIGAFVGVFAVAMIAPIYSISAAI